LSLRAWLQPDSLYVELAMKSTENTVGDVDDLARIASPGTLEARRDAADSSYVTELSRAS